MMDATYTSQTHVDGNGGCFHHILHSFRRYIGKNAARNVLMKGGGTHPPQASGEDTVLSGCYKEKVWRDVMPDRRLKVKVALTALIRTAVGCCLSAAASSKYCHVEGNKPPCICIQSYSISLHVANMAMPKVTLMALYVLLGGV